MNYRMTLLENNISKFNTAISRKKTSCSILKKTDMWDGSGAYTTFRENGDIEVFLPLILQESYVKKSHKTAVDARAIWGTNFHELAHILYSDHEKNPLQGIVRKYNPMVLEENRVEFLYFCEFPGNEKWLEYGVLKATDNFNIHSSLYMSNDLNEVLRAYMLFSARTWIEDIHNNLRSNLMRLWGKKNVNKLDSLILKFCALKKSELGNSKCRKVMRDIEKLLPKDYQGYLDDADCPFGHVTSENVPSSDYDDSNAVGIAEQIIDDGSPIIVVRSNHDSDQGESKGSAFIIDEEFMEKQQEDANIDVKNSDDNSSVYAGFYYYDNNVSIVNTPIDQNIVNKKRIMERELEKINDAVQSGYLHGLPSGSVDMNVAFNPYRDIDRMFYQWTPGIEDAASIELVILVDCSGSMDDQTQEVMESVYPIISAFYDFEGISNINVFAFNETCHTVYNDKQVISPLQVAYPVASGGTDPSMALSKAISIFENSLIERKVLLVFTDGEWHQDQYHYKNIMRKIKSLNVSTGYMMYGQSYNDTYRMFDYYIESDNINDFGKMANMIVVESMKNDIEI